MPAKKTLVGAIALLGEDAIPSDGPVDIVIDGRLTVHLNPDMLTHASHQVIVEFARLHQPVDQFFRGGFHHAGSFAV